MSTCYIAPNGKPSTLYNQLKSAYGEGKAAKIYLNTRTNTFRKWFGDYVTRQKLLTGVTKDTAKDFKIRDEYKQDLFVDENGEPKLFYLSNPAKIDYTFEGPSSMLEKSLNKESSATLKDNTFPVVTTDKKKGKGNPFFVSSKKITYLKTDEEITPTHAGMIGVAVGIDPKTNNADINTLYILKSNALYETGKSLEDQIYHTNPENGLKVVKDIMKSVESYITYTEIRSHDFIYTSNGKTRLNTAKAKLSRPLIDFTEPFLQDHMDSNPQFWNMVFNEGNEALAQVLKTTKKFYPKSDKFTEGDQKVEAMSSYLKMTEGNLDPYSQKIVNSIKNKMAKNLEGVMPSDFTLQTKLGDLVKSNRKVASPANVIKSTASKKVKPPMKQSNDPIIKALKKNINNYNSEIEKDNFQIKISAVRIRRLWKEYNNKELSKEKLIKKLGSLPTNKTMTLLESKLNIISDSDFFSSPGVTFPINYGIHKGKTLFDIQNMAKDTIKELENFLLNNFPKNTYKRHHDNKNKLYKKITNILSKLFDKEEMSNLTPMILDPNSTDLIIEMTKGRVQEENYFKPPMKQIDDSFTSKAKMMRQQRHDSNKSLIDIIKEHSAQVRFDADDLDSRNAMTGLPDQKHDYIYPDGTKADTSGTGLIKQYKHWQFENSKIIKDNILSQGKKSKFKKLLTGEDENGAINEINAKLYMSEWVDAILNNDLAAFFTFLDNKNIDYLEYKAFIESVHDDMFLLIKGWQIRAHVGTWLHRAAEALIKEDNHLEQEDHEIIAYFDGLKDKLKANKIKLNDLLTKTDTEGKEIELTPDNKVVERKLKAEISRQESDIEFRKNLDAFAKGIRDRGGKILTEVIVHTETLKNYDNKGMENSSLAGQIDVLAVFEHDDTVEIYDWKTMNQKPYEKKPYYGEGWSDYDKKIKEYGYKTDKQSKHNFQLQLYARILEQQLGVKTRGAYVIPITTPSVDIMSKGLDSKGNPAYEVHGGYRFIPTEAERNEDIDKPSIAINIKDLYDYDINTQRVLSHLPNKMVEETDQDNDEFHTDNITDEFHDFIGELQVYLEKRIKKVNTDLKNDESEELRALLRKYQNDLQEAKNSQKIAKFILNAHEELVGSSTVLSLEEKMIIAATEEIKGNRVKMMDRYRMQTQTYAILDKVRNNLLFSSDDLVKNAAAKSILDKLNEAITARDRTMNYFYEKASTMMSKTLDSFRSDLANHAVDEHYRYVLATKKEDMDKAENLYNQAIMANSPDLIKRKKNFERNKRQYNYAKKQSTDLKVSPEQILAELKELPNDISVFSYHAISASSSSDKILSLFAKMTKFEFRAADMEVKRVGMRIEDAINNFGGTKEAISLLKDNTEEFFDAIIEKDEMWVKNPDTDKKELQVVNRLVGKYGKHDYKNEDGKIIQLTHTNIIKDYKRRIQELREDTKIAESRALQDEFNDWKDDNLMSDKTDAYNAMYEPFKRDDIGKEAWEKIKEIRARINTLYDSARLDKTTKNLFPQGRSMYHLTSAERAEFHELEKERKLLSSKFHADGTDKSAHDKEIAERIREYNTEFARRHDFKTDKSLYESMRQQAHDAYGAESKDFERWMSENTVISTNSSFNLAYNRKRKEKMALVFAFNNGHDHLIKWMESIKVRSINISDWQDAFDKYLKDKDIIEEWDEYYAEAEINAKIRDILKPYRIDGTVDGSLISDKAQAKITALQQKQNDLFQEQKKAENKKGLVRSKAQWALYLRRFDKYSKAIKNFVKYPATSQYYTALAFEKQKNQQWNEKFGKNRKIEETTWYKRNHVFGAADPLTKERKAEPSRAWTQTTHKNTLMDKDGNIQYYKDIKDATGKITRKKVTDPYIEHSPNSRYKKSNIKEKTEEGEKLLVDKDDKTVYNEFGYLLPKSEKWENQKYKDLKEKNPAMFKLFKVLRDEYYAAQALVPEGHQLGDILPFIKKSASTIIKDSKGGKLGRLIEVGKDNIFIDKTVDVAFANADTSNIDDKYVPVNFTKYIKDDVVDKDVISGIMKFIASANRHNAANNIAAEARTLVALIDKREADTGLGTAQTLAGETIMDTTFAKFGIERSQRKPGESRAALLTKAFIEMQIFGELTKPTIRAVGNDGALLSIDKVVGIITGAASMTQIGGTGVVGVMKGMANAIQAELQQYIESAAKEFYTTKDWRRAWARFAHDSKDLYQDLGRATNKTLIGQMVDVFDALQGEFLDSFGNKVTGSIPSRMFTSSAWFFNQYSGEFTAAMTSLYSMLGNHKIIDGKPYSLQQYLMDKEKEKGSNLTNKDRVALEKVHEAVTESLMDHIHVNPDTGLLGVKEGVEWVLGLDEATEKKRFGEEKYQELLRKQDQFIAKLHGVNKRLNGAYADFDRVLMQRKWYSGLALMYKKYLAPALRKRYQWKVAVDQELETITEGFYATTVKVIYRERSKMMAILADEVVPGRDPSERLSPMERKNLRRAVREITTLLVLTLMVAFLDFDDDDDKTQAGWLTWIALYELNRARKELGGVVIGPWAFKDNWKIIKNPLSASTFVENIINVFMQLFDPTAQYQQKSGLNQKGDYKMLNRILKILGTGREFAEYATDDRGFEELLKEITKEQYTNVKR